MLNKFITRSATTAILLAAPAMAGAETIAIHVSDTSNQNGNSGERPRYVANGLTLDFIIRSDMAATGVTFLLTDGKHATHRRQRKLRSRRIDLAHLRTR